MVKWFKMVKPSIFPIEYAKNHGHPVVFCSHLETRLLFGSEILGDESVGRPSINGKTPINVGF